MRRRTTTAPTLTPPQFRITRTDEAGVTEWTSTHTQHDTASLLRRGIRVRRATVEAHRSGGFLMQWRVYRVGLPPRIATITGEPLIPARLTTTMRADLETITTSPIPARFAAGGALLIGLTHDIPRARAARLAARGLLAEHPDTTTRTRPIVATLSARLALLAHHHRTTTRQPRGYYRPGEYHRLDDWALSAGLCKGGGRGGLLHDRTSSATCSCGQFSESAHDRRDAAHRARTHRQHAAADLIATL